VEHLQGASLGLAPGLIHKHYSKMERLAREKPSSLLWKSVNYGRNRFYDTGLGSPLGLLSL
jgi:hypothetical protein